MLCQIEEFWVALSVAPSALQKTSSRVFFRAPLQVRTQETEILGKRSQPGLLHEIGSLFKLAGIC